MQLTLLAPAMFGVLMIGLLAGFPVAFSLAVIATVFGVIGIVTGHFTPEFLFAMPLRMIGIFFNDNLLAIPFFTFMGMLLERTRIAEEMLESLGELLAGVRGGLAYAVIIVGAILAATTGVVSASVIAMGLISLPVMLRAGYDPRLATGVIAASGTLAQVIPPGLVLIVLAEQLEVPLGDIYRGALLPSLMLIGLYMGYVFVATRFNSRLAPPLHNSPVRRPQAKVLAQAVVSAGLPLLLLATVLASIYFGIATPSEGGAVGVVGALLLALFKGRLSGRNLRQAMDTTGILCSCVIFLLLGASFFTLVFRGLDGHLWIENLVHHIPGGTLGFLIFLNLTIFGLAFFLDFFEIAFIVLPLVQPIAVKMGINMTWLAVLLAVNMQTSFMHPPFGIALYNLRSVAPSQVKTLDIYKGAIPFLLLQLLMAGILIVFPDLVSLDRSDRGDPGSDELHLPMPANESN